VIIIRLSKVKRYKFNIELILTMNLKNKEELRKEYVVRINKAINHIEKHIASPLNLETISKAASFSPFHFHRIFKSL